jgi:RNA polymerase sigma factor (sigma-70 family)
VRPASAARCRFPTLIGPTRSPGIAARAGLTGTNARQAWKRCNATYVAGHVGSVTDDDRFEALYEALYDDLLRYALRRVAQPADAADVVAETWIVAWRRRDQMPSGDQRRLWLFGVIRRVLANQRRGQLRRNQLADRLRADLPPAVEEPQSGLDERVSRALGRLSPRDRDVLSMLAWEQLRPEEIAAVMGCSPAAARVRIHRARRRLRAELGRTGVTSDDGQPASARLAKEIA